MGNSNTSEEKSSSVGKNRKNSRVRVFGRFGQRKSKDVLQTPDDIDEVESFHTIPFEKEPGDSRSADIKHPEAREGSAESAFDVLLVDETCRDNQQKGNCDVVILREQTNSSSSDSFTDPLSSIGFGTEINQCYISEENICSTADEETLKEITSAALASRNYTRKSLTNGRSTKQKLANLTFSEIIFFNLSANEFEQDPDMSVNLRNKMLQMGNIDDKNGSEQTIFNVSKAKKVELHNLSSRIPESAISAQVDSSAKNFSPGDNQSCVLISSLSGTPKTSAPVDANGTPTNSQEASPGVAMDSNVLKKVASFTVDRSNGDNSPKRPSFVPEKLNLAAYEKFEGQMLMKWFMSTLQSGSCSLSEQALNAISLQCCTNLLNVGVIQQISDKSPESENFNPFQMYQWTHNEIPVSALSTPGKLDAVEVWPHGITESLNMKPKPTETDAQTKIDSSPKMPLTSTPTHNDNLGKSSMKLLELKRQLLDCNTEQEILHLVTAALPQNSESDTECLTKHNRSTPIKDTLDESKVTLINLELNATDLRERAAPDGSELRKDDRQNSSENVRCCTCGGNRSDNKANSKTMTSSKVDKIMQTSFSHGDISSSSVPETKNSIPTPAPQIAENCKKSFSPPAQPTTPCPPPPPPMPPFIAPPPPPPPPSGALGPLTCIPPPPPPPPPPAVLGQVSNGPPPPPPPQPIGGPPPPPPLPPISGGVPTPVPPPLSGLQMPGTASKKSPSSKPAPPPPPLGEFAAPPPPPPLGLSQAQAPIPSPTDILPMKTPTAPTPLPMPPAGGAWFQANSLRKNAVNPPKPMRPLYWTRIVAPKISVETDEVSEEDRKELWQEIDETSLDNIDEFTELFSRQVVAPKPKPEKVKTEKLKVVNVLDGKRAQNVGIFARSLHIDFAEIEHAIYHCDTAVVSLETLQKIMEIKATPEELSMIQEAAASNMTLDAPEQFLLKVASISSSAERISCIVFQAEFEEGYIQVSRKLEIVKQLSLFLLDNEDLKLLFSIILTLGNYMNGGNRTRGQADGFGLEILPKLKDVKSKDSKTTLLHFIVKTYIKRQMKDVTLLSELNLPIPEPGDVVKAVAVDFEEVMQQIADLKRKLAVCKGTTEKVIASSKHSNLQPFKDKMEEFISVATRKIEKQLKKLDDCRNTFIKTMRFYHFIPKSGTLEQCTPGQFFEYWAPFTNDFKDIWKKEIAFLSTELLKKVKQQNKHSTTKTSKLKPGSLKERIQRLSRK